MEQLAHLKVYITTHPPLVVVRIEETSDILSTPGVAVAARIRRLAMMSGCDRFILFLNFL